MKYLLNAVLILAGIALTYLVYDSIQSKIDFNKEAARREGIVVERLIDIRKAQVSYKTLYGKYADSFEKLMGHVAMDSMPVVKMVGAVPDTLTEAEAVAQGLVIRDTFKISVRDTLFAQDYHLDSLRYVPFSEGGTFKIQAGEIEKNKLHVQVFEVSANLKQIYNGLDLSNESLNLSKLVKVGSMTEPTTNGNWE